MDTNSFARSIENEMSSLVSSFEDHGDHYVLNLNEDSVKFLKTTSHFAVKPNEWLEWKNGNGSVHEPGMVAALQVLARACKGPVIFYDVGALFGYFSFIVESIFENARCKIVEGNPYSAQCIREIADGRPAFEVVNAVVGLERGRKRFFVVGFKFIDMSSLSGRMKKLTIDLKNAIKRVVGVFGGRFQQVTGDVFNVEEVALPDIFAPRTEGTIEIFKLDTEGFQGLFLPPFIDQLCARNPIVLLELDRPDLMAQFGTTNHHMLRLFLDRGFSAVWTDHRTVGPVMPVTAISHEQDKNSLCIILPPTFA